MVKERGKAATEYNRPFIPQKVILGSHTAQEVFRRVFDPTAESLYSLGVVLRVIGTEEQAVAAEKVVDEMIAKVSDELAGENARFGKLLEDNGIDGTVEFTAPQEVEAKVSSPRAGRFLALIREIDKLVARMTALWLCGVLTESQYTKGNHRWISRMRGVSLEVRNLNRRALRAAAQKRNQDQQAAAKKREGKKARAARNADPAEPTSSAVVTAEPSRPGRKSAAGAVDHDGAVDAVMLTAAVEVREPLIEEVASQEIEEREGEVQEVEEIAV